MKVNYLLIGTFLSLFILCYEEPEDLYRSLDHTQWFKYEEGDTLLYACNASLVDTYITDRFSNFYAKPLSTYDEILMVDYKEIPQCNNCPISSFTRSPNGVRFFG